MALPTSGVLSLSDIAGEFGGAVPHSLSEYYAGGLYVPAGTSGTNGPVPSAGTISIEDFYGTANVISRIYNPFYADEIQDNSGTIITGGSQFDPLGQTYLQRLQDNQIAYDYTGNMYTLHNSLATELASVNEADITVTKAEMTVLVQMVTQTNVLGLINPEISARHVFSVLDTDLVSTELFSVIGDDEASIIGTPNTDTTTNRTYVYDLLSLMNSNGVDVAKVMKGGFTGFHKTQKAGAPSGIVGYYELDLRFNYIP